MHSFIRLSEEQKEYISQASEILSKTFPKRGIYCWSEPEEAKKEVIDCLNGERIAIALVSGDSLIGWGGLRPMYENTWELHPMVVQTEYQGKGYGKLLLNEIEKAANEKGVIGIVLGADDESHETSISEKELDASNIYHEMSKIANYKKHPVDFYRKSGYMVVGVIPDANGYGKTDIIMWKKIV